VVDGTDVAAAFALPPYAVPGRAVPPLRPEGANLAAVVAEAATAVVAVAIAVAVAVAFAPLLSPLLAGGAALPLLPSAATVPFAAGACFASLLPPLGFVPGLFEVAAAVAFTDAFDFVDAALGPAPALAVAEDAFLCVYAFVASAGVRGTFSASCE